MQNGEYYWIKMAPGFDEWTIGQFTGTVFSLCGSELSITPFQIGPKVIGYDEVLVPSHLYRGAMEELRDRFAMAALSSLGAEMSPDETADAAYEYADAMLDARSKLKS